MSLNILGSDTRVNSQKISFTDNFNFIEIVILLKSHFIIYIFPRASTNYGSSNSDVFPKIGIPEK